MFANAVLNAVAGGILIGLAASWLFLSLGRVAGISGIVGQAIKQPGTLWPVWLIVGGLVVGFGTRLGSGCTSGHGVCGIARMSPRSMVATIIFVGLGMLTATLLRGLGVVDA